ncbi:MAG: HD domain-containing protein [Nitrospirae bacterium]|nr:HD domain-containing protein [Nitrospirota bacterium]
MATLKNFITTFMIAVSNCSLYTKEHEAFDELAKNAFSALNGLLDESFEIMIIENNLVINKTPVRDAGIHNANLVKRLKRKGITRIDFLKGVTLSEVKQIIIDLSEPGKGLTSCPHIKTGIVDVSVSAPWLDAGSIPFSTSDNVEKVQKVFHSISPFRQLPVTELEEVVFHFIATFKREANILKVLSPVKSFSEYTYTHATNVAVLSIFQAESLGIKDELLHDIGISALLHDTGKMFVPKEILEKAGALDDKEFAEMKKHPLYGARYLAKMSDIPRLAPVIAFEHHLKYDGSGYPGLCLEGKRQHIGSQIVAISDFFDALRTHRPYRKSVDAKTILVMMGKSAGKDFNPFLVDNFIRILQPVIN